MLREYVAIKDVNLRDPGFCHEIKDIGAGAAKPHYADPMSPQSRVDRADTCAARRRIDVFEYVSISIGRDRWINASTCFGIDLCSFPSDAADIGRHFVMVV